MLSCADAAEQPRPVIGSARLTSVSWPPVAEGCPLCAKTPVEPVRLEGQMACRGCTSSCVSCSAPCVPGDELCQQCLALMSPLAVPA
ncbi:hypothetical protein [Mycobacterium sp.]|uniref:hypothetical protein n=1 Tax=Mycobacterium sp. TaxID=1785 RepID=UPI0025EAB697|nr:hypothetical protein [Mycobacterium sp.]